MQAIKGFFDFQIGEYLLWYVLPNAIDLALVAALAIFVQALSPHKFVGWAVMVVYLISTVVLHDAGLRGQSLPVRQRSDRAALGHERSGPLLDRRPTGSGSTGPASR